MEGLYFSSLNMYRSLLYMDLWLLCFSVYITPEFYIADSTAPINPKCIFLLLC